MNYKLFVIVKFVFCDYISVKCKIFCTVKENEQTFGKVIFSFRE